MRIIYFFAIVTFLLSCNSQKTEKQDSNVVVSKEIAVPVFSVAEQFINEYIQFLSSPEEDKNVENWLQNHPLLSADFKKSYKAIIEEAYKADLEMGLGFDPVLNAQDFPEKGFIISKIDRTSNYVTVKGVDWDDFNVTMKVISDNGKWLVDGSGSVNI